MISLFTLDCIFFHSHCCTLEGSVALMFVKTAPTSGKLSADE